MFEKLKWKYKDWVLRQFHKYFQVGCHCGFCGKWIPEAIGDIGWAWDYCDECRSDYFNDRNQPIGHSPVYDSSM